jgi:hypothetical protein
MLCADDWCYASHRPQPGNVERTEATATGAEEQIGARLSARNAASETALHEEKAALAARVADLEAQLAEATATVQVPPPPCKTRHILQSVFLQGGAVYVHTDPSL